MSRDHETPTEADTSHLMASQRITVDELAVHLSAIDLRLRQLARAAELPATPVELADTIDSLRGTASTVRELGERMTTLARIMDGDIPLRPHLPQGDPWGTAALGTDREDFGGPAVIPTQWQLLRLATEGQRDAESGRETTTYPKGMEGVPRSVLLSWESKAAAARRRRERDAAVTREVLLITCERCGAGSGEHCTTAKGWQADQAHVARQREAELRVDERLGYLGDNPVAVHA
ncbi:zinc finger domain-containing protein [Streptomyces abikoensis]